MEEFIKNMTYLGLAYDKQYTQEEIKLYYDFLKYFSDDVIVKAIKEIIKTSKFIPKINELIEKCEEIKKETQYEIIEKMKNQGYFKTTQEYEKAIMFLNTNIIPKWFIEDMKKYQQDNLQITNKEIKQIENKDNEIEELLKDFE